MSTESRSLARTFLRPAPKAERPASWASTLGVDLSSLSDSLDDEVQNGTSSEPIASAVAETENVSSFAPLASVGDDHQSLESVLEELLAFDGSIGVAIVDGQSGMMLGEAGSANNLGLSAAGASVILRARGEMNQALGRAEEIVDVLVTLSSQVQIIRPLSKNSNLFVYMVGDKTKSSLAMARYKAAEADNKIRL